MEVWKSQIEVEKTGANRPSKQTLTKFNISGVIHSCGSGYDITSIKTVANETDAFDEFERYFIQELRLGLVEKTIKKVSVQ